MFSQFQNYFFWFAQPSSILGSADLMFGYFFTGCLILAILIVLTKRFLKHQIKAKLANKFFSLLLTIGISGLVWFGFRYENTPIFAQRYWAGLVLGAAFIWLIFILKYIIFNYFSELAEYEHELVKSKYLPGVKAR